MKKLVLSMEEIQQQEITEFQTEETGGYNEAPEELFLEEDAFFSE